ncbi:MAG: RusA family crossover junction endodeoxyribonuclease [Lachnospiraceae bacterium]|nr:RusA family crossover junction endodeoxyribonuclease [Lachnospiraceae bacterium]
MKQKFTIEGRLPSLNEYIKAERTTRFAAATMKKSWQNFIVGCIRHAKLKKVGGPVTLLYDHFVPDKRRDRDNISSIVHKFTQDALVTSGILKDDGWDYVVNSIDEWHIDRKNPRIEVTIEEVEL